MSRSRVLALVLLRTIVGWHFLYEGYYKLLVPGWSMTGAPLGAWSSAGYLRSATGPFAGIFHQLAATQMGGVVDLLVPIGLACSGLSLMLGLYTQLGAWVALLFMTLFYVAYIPMHGVPVPNAEGTYLIVNKTLVEWAAVLVILVFHTDQMAGLDLWRKSRVRRTEGRKVPGV